MDGGKEEGFRGSDLEIRGEIGDGRMSMERGVMMKRETEEMLKDKKKQTRGKTYWRRQEAAPIKGVRLLLPWQPYRW